MTKAPSKTAAVVAVLEAHGILVPSPMRSLALLPDDDPRKWNSREGDLLALLRYRVICWPRMTMIVNAILA